MKEQIQTLLSQALSALRERGELPTALQPEPQLTRTKEREHGDLASNIALALAKPAKRNPRQLAELIVAALPESPLIARCEIAGPGFINFFLAEGASRAVIGEILDRGDAFGRSDHGQGRRVQVEFVSANPTGPLHVGHGRGAAYGAAVADLLEAVGFDVHREYYVNDAGRQMNILAASVWLRYLEQCGETLPFPANGYKGDYVRDIAAKLYDEHGTHYRHPVNELLAELPPDEPDGGDKELYIDAIIARSQQLLGDNRYRYLFELGLNDILDDIRDDLAEFGVEYEQWYSERSLTDRGAVNRAIELLRERDWIYEKGGALWFKSSELGDEKDRVVQRENGQTTYFASDIAYHMDKLERGFERVIDVWGADHHGYIPRVKAALTALGQDEQRLDVLLVQFANLYRSGEKVSMSTRSGSFVTLRELRDEVGRDAARYFYVMRKCEQHLDFDLDLAKSQSNDNPVYYVQYAHARVCRVMEQLLGQGLAWDREIGEQHYELLSEAHEEALLEQLARYPELLLQAALNEEPHALTYYLRDLANAFHSYYNAHTFLVDEEGLRNARLNLIIATRQVLKNGLELLGVSAPEMM